MGDLTPRKSMASGQGMPHDDFGVGKFGTDHIKGEGPNGRTLGLGERGVGAPVKHSADKLPAQGQVDHGNHGLVHRGSGA